MMVGLVVLEQSRASLRLLYLGALLHNLGKVDRRFLDKQMEPPSQSRYQYQHILHLITKDFPALSTDLAGLHGQLQHADNKSALDDTLCTLMVSQSISLPPPFDKRCFRVGDLIEYLGQGDLQRGKKLYGSQGFIMHIFPPDGAPLLQLMNRSHDAASGGEKGDLKNEKLEKSGGLWLATPMGFEVPLDIDKVDGLRDKTFACIRELLKSSDGWGEDLRGTLSQALADTRRPLNDVTMWDLGSSGAALLLSAASGAILSGRALSHGELDERGADNRLFWRLLSVRVDGLGWLGAASTMMELRSRKRLMTGTFDRLADTVHHLAVGREIYRDESGLLFIVPDLDQGATAITELKQRLNDARSLDGLRLSFDLSDRLVGHPTQDQGSAPYVGERVAGILRSPAPREANQGAFNCWNGIDAAPICTGCGIRPQGWGAHDVEEYSENSRYYARKAARRRLCCVCMRRRMGVSREWCGALGEPTIWTDEAADANGRLALVTGRFDVVEFMTGLQYPRKNSASPGMEPSHSFARMRRVWETCRWFWDSALTLTLPDGSPAVPVVRRRYAIRGKLLGTDGPGDFHAYQLAAEQLRVPAVWDANEGRFIILHDAGRRLPDIKIDQTLSIIDPDERGRGDGRRGAIQVTALDEIATPFMKAIPILAEPMRFMAVVPGDRALGLCQAVRREYLRQMGKVRGRLPLHLGIVFFDRHTPMRAALDAGRRLLQVPVSARRWTVHQCAANGEEALVEFTNGQTWRVPLQMGDRTEDRWYPFFYLDMAVQDYRPGPDGCAYLGHRPLPGGRSEPCWMVHAKCLRPGDSVWVTPSLFDFVYLDAGGRRFELAYDAGGDDEKPRRLDPEMLRRPFYLDDLGRLEDIWRLVSRRLTSTQIHQVLGSVETRRASWDGNQDGLTQVVDDLLSNAAWSGGWKGMSASDRDLLSQGAADGTLWDVCHLYMEILKRRPRRRQKEGEI